MQSRLALGLALLALASLPRPVEAQGLPTVLELDAAWNRLAPNVKAEAVEWFRFECSQLSSPRAELVRSVLARNTEDPGSWEARGPIPVFDPEVHAPAQPIAREVLDEGDPKVEQARRRFLPLPNLADLRPAYEYDWATGNIVRVADPDDPDRILANAARGYPVDLDIAIAVLVRELDRGESRKAALAFSHAYTDRDGGVYPGIRLSDAWASGERLEMPDVDTLGIVHTILDDWETWVAPIPEKEQDELYDTIATYYRASKNYRELREYLARVYFLADPVPIGVFGASRTALHAAWAGAANDPEKMVEHLPDGSGTQAFLKNLLAGLRNDAALTRSGSEREAQLRKDRQAMTRVLVGILKELGAFDAPASDEESKHSDG